MLASNVRLKLHDYQEQATDEVIAALARRPILVAPTRSAKTVMAVARVERLGVPTLWLARRKELIDQAAARLQAHELVSQEGEQVFPVLFQVDGEFTAAPSAGGSGPVSSGRSCPPVGGELTAAAPESGAGSISADRPSLASAGFSVYLSVGAGADPWLVVAAGGSAGSV